MSLRPQLHHSFAHLHFSTKMTVTNEGLESFLQNRENIAHIAGSKFVFVRVAPEVFIYTTMYRIHFKPWRLRIRL